MTTDLERMFFNTFGIKPKYTYLVTDTFYTDDSHTYGVTKNDLIDCFEGKNCGRYKVTEVYKTYPKITDIHYLKLICILTEWRQYCASDYIVKAININILKNDILKDCLYMLNWYEFKKCGNDIKQQVQELFRENI